MQFGDHRLNTGVRPEPRNTTVKMAMQTPLDEPILELLDDPSDQQLTDVISKLQDNQDVFRDRVRWIVRHTKERHGVQETFIDAVICMITGAPTARKGQIQAIQSLVYQQQDTVLVAATGYGKSAVLYAFTAITEKITVQIVPLTKLGEAQVEGIKKDVPGSTPVWIDADTHLKHPNTWEEIKASKYSHILLSPEQALHPKFKAVLRDPRFHDTFWCLFD